jgi:predicted dehydrogenase
VNANVRSQSVSRRRFIRQTTGAAAALAVVPASVFAADGTAPNSRINLAGVGVGGVGFGQLQACEDAGFQISALCDVDDVYAKKAFDKWPQARRYRDFREMLETEGDKIDAVYCGTPDHTHTLVSLAAIRRKKHVCCVKPLTRTLHELEILAKAARQAGVATQVTASANTSDVACRTCELIAAGVIGPVREVHLWSNRPLWPQGMLRPPGEDPVPPTLNWKLWLGPATLRPFKDKWPADSYPLAQVNLPGKRKPSSDGVYHPWNFRGWWDFGTGALGDMGCHHFNTPLRALKLTYPTHIETSATKVFDEATPLASIVTYDYPARGDLPPLRAIWYDGGLKPPRPAQFDEPMPEDGNLYVGDHGCLLAAWGGIKVFPASRVKQFEGIPKTLPRRGGTWKEWFEACRGGEPAGCNFDWAEPLTAVVLLGNIAIRTGQRLAWDATQRKFTNSADANRLLQEPYHNGWSLETI